MKYVENKFTNSNELANKFIPKSNNVTWKDFVEKINEYITKTQNQSLNAQDKQLGVYFVDQTQLVEVNDINNHAAAEKFAQNVLMYLWEDVSKLNREEWFKGSASNSIDSLLNKYYEDKIESILNDNIISDLDE